MSCARCNGTGRELWLGRIVNREAPILDGPCLRCRWQVFWKAYDAVGTPRFNEITFKGDAR